MTLGGRRFTGKVVLVTGGSSGIGRTTAIAFARAGATVVVGGRDTDRLARTVKDIEAEGTEGSAVVADIGHGPDVANLVAETVRRHGRLDIAVNNAGILGPIAPTADLSDEDFAMVVQTNVTGTWLCMKHQIGHMREHGGGVIVNITSNIGTHVRRPGMAAYAASKAAVGVLTRTAARDHIGDNIRINSVSPGATDTDMSLRPGETEADRTERMKTAIPAGRVGTTQEIANAVLWLASDEATFAVGHDLVIDGGTTA